MVLQIQAEGEQWQDMETFLSNPPGPVVIDHFGRTAPADSSGGFESLLRAATHSEQLWFKFSAPYRTQAGAAAACGARILDTVGIHRILWGSDWPHTQFEGRWSYAEALRWLVDWVPDAGDRTTILRQNPAMLFRCA
jgi:predicted TIM-barrel fold metal-dependent hydrolase